MEDLSRKPEDPAPTLAYKAAYRNGGNRDSRDRTRAVVIDHIPHDLEIRIGNTRRAKNPPFDAGIFYNRDLLEQPGKEILAKKISSCIIIRCLLGCRLFRSSINVK